MALPQRPQTFRELLVARERRTSDENGNYACIGQRQCYFDFDAHVIGGIIKPALAPFIAGIEPFRSDEDHHHRACPERFCDVFGEHRAGWDAILIAEDRVRRKLRREIRIDAVNQHFGIGPPIADEDGVGRQRCGHRLCDAVG